MLICEGSIEHKFNTVCVCVCVCMNKYGNDYKTDKIDLIEITTFKKFRSSSHSLIV